MFLTIAGVIVALILVALVIASMKPSTFRIERSMSIKAAPAKIFPYINDFHQWAAWSPWEGLDPSLNRTFSGAPAGKGSIYDWNGNNKVGTGRMEITDAVAPSRVTIKLDFFKPFEAHNTAEFTMQAVGDSTTVTWSMTGPSPFMRKLMTMFFSIDNMLAKDFDKGLSKLRTAAEA